MLLYKFLWNDKPDKVNRETICKNNFNRGLKMINIFEFEKVLKVNWIKRIHNQIGAQWNILLSNCYGNLNNLFNLGGEHNNA